MAAMESGQLQRAIMKALVEAGKPLTSGELFEALHGKGRKKSREVSTMHAVRKLRDKGYVVIDQVIIGSRATNVMRPHPDYEE